MFYISLASVSLSLCVLVYGLRREQRGSWPRWDARTLFGRRPAALWVPPPRPSRPVKWCCRAPLSEIDDLDQLPLVAAPAAAAALALSRDPLAELG